MVLAFAPKALRTPISRVRSVTETNIIFISAIVEPKIVMILIIQAAIYNTLVFSAALFNKSSLRSIPKLLSSTGFKPLIFLNVKMASS